MSFDKLDTLLKKESAETWNDSQSLPGVMVVDDDRSVRQALDFALQDRYRVCLCASGIEATTAIDSDIHTVVLDIKMPGMDGFVVYERIKEKFPNLPIIFHSAYHDLKDPFVIMNEYQPFGYITKGQDQGFQQLLDMIHRAVEHYTEMVKMESLIDKLKKIYARFEAQETTP